MSETQRKYSTYDRELLAIYLAVKHNRYIIEGRESIILTDYKPIMFAFKQRPEKASPRQLRHLDLIGQYCIDIRYISGKDNIVADALSRIESISKSEIGHRDIAQLQSNDEELTSLLSPDSNTHIKLHKITIHDSELPLFCDISQERVRPFIPQALRKQIFNLVHNVCHPGKHATSKLITERYFWPDMKKDATR